MNSSLLVSIFVYLIFGYTVSSKTCGKFYLMKSWIELSVINPTINDGSLIFLSSQTPQMFEASWNKTMQSNFFTKIAIIWSIVDIDFMWAFTLKVCFKLMSSPVINRIEVYLSLCVPYNILEPFVRHQQTTREHWIKPTVPQHSWVSI